MAQEIDTVGVEEIDTINIRPDTLTIPEAQQDSVFLAKAEKFTINFYIDYGKLLTLPTNFERKFEGGIYIRFNRKWVVGAEGGFAELTPLRPYRNGDAEAIGIYYGGFLQYFVNLDAMSALFIGAGYKQGTFDDKITYTISSLPWGETTYIFERKDLKASWATLRIGTEQKLNRYLALGGVFELRIKTQFDKPEGLLAFSIPGYGQADNSTSPALNLYLKLSL